MVVLKPLTDRTAGEEMFIPLDAEGTFKLKDIPPGLYQLKLTDCNFRSCRLSLPKTITIEPTKTTLVKIEIDTGIR